MENLAKKEKAYDTNVIKLYQNDPEIGWKLWKIFPSMKDFQYWMKYEKDAQMNIDADQLEVNGYALFEWCEFNKFLKETKVRITEDHIAIFELEEKSEYYNGRPRLKTEIAYWNKDEWLENPEIIIDIAKAVRDSYNFKSEFKF